MNLHGRTSIIERRREANDHNYAKSDPFLRIIIGNPRGVLFPFSIRIKFVHPGKSELVLHSPRISHAFFFIEHQGEKRYLFVLLLIKLQYCDTSVLRSDPPDNHAQDVRRQVRLIRFLNRRQLPRRGVLRWIELIDVSLLLAHRQWREYPSRCHCLPPWSMDASADAFRFPAATHSKRAVSEDREKEAFSTVQPIDRITCVGGLDCSVFDGILYQNKNKCRMRFLFCLPVTFCGICCWSFFLWFIFPRTSAHRRKTREEKLVETCCVDVNDKRTNLSFHVSFRVSFSFSFFSPVSSLVASSATKKRRKKRKTTLPCLIKLHSTEKNKGIKYAFLHLSF